MLRHPISARHLAAASVALACAVAFVVTAREVVQGGVIAVDRIVASLIPPLPPWGVEVVRDLTSLGGPGVLMLVVLLVVGYLVISRRWRSALLVASATVTGLLVCGALKGLYDRPRPDLAVAPYAGGTDSFPSGHALMATVVYLTLASQVMRLLHLRRDKICCALVAVLMAGLVGISRVLLGVHHPSDVIAGWALGAVWATACWLAGRSLQRHGHVEAG
jgi:undecaprenyl-diphosphatase